MSDLMLRTTIKTQATAHSFVSALIQYAQAGAERMGREQTGQDMVEYGGVILVIAAIIAAVFATNLDSTIATKISGLVNDVFTGTKPS